MDVVMPDLLRDVPVDQIQATFCIDRKLFKVVQLKDPDCTIHIVLQVKCFMALRYQQLTKNRHAVVTCLR